jgi:excisionase family DNA binding protein
MTTSRFAQQPLPTPQYYSRRQAAAYLGVSEAAIIKWERTGRIPRPSRFGRSVRYHLPTLEMWAAAQRENQ